MIKNLFKRNMLVIFAIAVLCSGIVTYSFIRSASSTNSFTQSGYVHVDTTESVDKRVLFSSGSKYKSAVDSKVRFTDVSNVERNIPNENFIHYDDNSIASFSGGVIVNIDELSSEESAMNHFHISSGMTLRNNGSSYSAENTGTEVDFSNFLWKISENKYLVVSKSLNAHFSNTDERECGKYAEITYLGGNVIQIQTEDNIWQTISDDCSLILDDGNIVDLSMRNIQDAQGNILVDFSRIILDSNDNIELTPMNDEMESINENVIPRFTVNNTPGDAGADGTSGIIGLTGVDGNSGVKGQQGPDGFSAEEAEKEDYKPFPVFYVKGWEVNANSCSGSIQVEDDGEMLVKSGDTASALYLVDLETGENIPFSIGAFDFAENAGTSDAPSGKNVEFSFENLRTDHSYMLYASAPIDPTGKGEIYSRGFVAKTFWTDSLGIYIEAAAVSTNSYDVVIHNNNINSNVGVYLFSGPFEDYNLLSSLILDDMKDGGAYNEFIKGPYWPVPASSSDIVYGEEKETYTNSIIVSDGTPAWKHSGDDDPEGILSNTRYYTMLVYDTNHDGIIDDYSSQILETLTLKRRPSVLAPSIKSNKNVSGFDVTPGVVHDLDGAVTKYTCEFYRESDIKNPTAGSENFILKDGAEPLKIVDLPRNASASISLGAETLGDDSSERYVVREVLTVYDNEKEYYVTSVFSNLAQLEKSVQPNVYFVPFGEPATEGDSPNSYLSPYYDTIAGILHVDPGKDSYFFNAKSPDATVQIQGDNYAWNFQIEDVTKEKLNAFEFDGTKFPAVTDTNGCVSIWLLDYQDERQSWTSGLSDGKEYYFTIYGDLYTDINNPEESTEKVLTTVGKCSIITPKTQGLSMVWSTNPSETNILKGLSMAVATPNQLRSKMNTPLNIDPANGGDPKAEAYYNRQLEMLYGVKISAYIGDYSTEKKYMPSTDTSIVKGKEYYIQKSSNIYEKVDLSKVDEDSVPAGNWFEYRTVELPEPWFEKTYTKKEPWKSGDYQVYMLYDSESKNEELKFGVQVVGYPVVNPAGKTIERYVLSKNGTIPKDESKFTYAYRDYEESGGKLVPSGGIANAITSDTVEGNRIRYKVRPLYEFDRIFESDIEKSRTVAKDFVINEGGFIIDEEDITVTDSDGKEVPFEEGVIGPKGIVDKQGALGLTFVIEEIFDYTGNPNDSSIERQQNVKVPTKDTFVDFENPIKKTYYAKTGDMYTIIDTDKMIPSQMGLYVYDEETNEYVLTSDTLFYTEHRYYYLYDGVYNIFNLDDINPVKLGWYENSSYYTNYFENVGEKRIYIPFSRTIQDINIEHPYNDETEPNGKIEYHTVSDDDQYHYYYTAQANFDNSQLLASTITYRVYDAVDFYNTIKHKNNDREYINWAILGKDPRITNPTDIFTDTWLIQDVQTSNDATTDEHVYQLVKNISEVEDIHPYMYGWYEKIGTIYKLTLDTSVVAGKKYYIDNGTSNPTEVVPTSINPQQLKWYEETIKETGVGTTVDESKTYYVKTRTSTGDVEYNIIDPTIITPSSLSWYTYDTVLSEYELSGHGAIDSETDYYYYAGEQNFVLIDQSFAAEGNVNPEKLGWCYGEKTITSKTSIGEKDRFYIKYLINVHSSDDNNSGGYSNYDTTISPVKLLYQEYDKVRVTGTAPADKTKTYYKTYVNENGKDCFMVVDLDANENKNKIPGTEGWYVDDTSSMIPSNDKYFDTEKQYFYNGSAVSINPYAKKWYIKTNIPTNDTTIDYSKHYHAKVGGVFTDIIDPNINPSQLGWVEYAKKVAPSGSTYNGSTQYYVKNGESYIPVGRDTINPNAIGWYESIKTVSSDGSFSKTYYAKVGDTYVLFDKDNIKPNDLGWFELNDKQEKVLTSDTEIKNKTYYVAVGQYNYVEVSKETTLTPALLQLFEEKKVLSNDIKAVSSKQYYASETSTTPISISSIDPVALGWYVDNTASKIATKDQAYNKDKVYFPSASSTNAVDSTFNPKKLEWYEEGWSLATSTDNAIDPNKEYAIRYLTNAIGSSAVTTDGLELAKITLSFNNIPNEVPSITFYPCTYDYAKDHYNVVPEANNVFFPDDSFEEMYGHQFIITWTINYYSYLSEFWHSCYPFDASAQLATTSATGEAGASYPATFVSLAEEYEERKMSSYVAGFVTKPSMIPNGTDTVFGKRAYMVIPHNYIALDHPKVAPTSYALQWDSGTESVGTTNENRFVTTRALVVDPYKAVYNYQSNDVLDPYAHTNVYIAGNGDPVSFAEMRINNNIAETLDENVAINNIIKATAPSFTYGDFAVSEIKITDKNAVGDFIDDATGARNIPTVAPIQLYSNKYVKQKESLHVISTNTYVTGSLDATVGTDANWKFKETTENTDKYAPLFTAIFNKYVDVPKITSKADVKSEMKIKPKRENQEITGYDIELIASPEILENVVGVRLRFDICDYRNATPEEVIGSPKRLGKGGLGLFVAQPSYEETTDTTVKENKVYSVYNSPRYYDYVKGTGTTESVIHPGQYGWYEYDGTKYIVTMDDEVVDGHTYYFNPKGKTTYEKVDFDKINPSYYGWYEKVYSDVKLTSDEVPKDNTTYLYQTDNVLYSMTIDKYLPATIASTDAYSVSKDGMKMLEIQADGNVHMYFGLGSGELDYDPDYKIGSTFGKLFTGKEGIRVYANYLYESDKAGFSYLKYSETDDVSGYYSNKADSVINNKESGTFAVRRYSLAPDVNKYYFLGNNEQYLAFTTPTGDTRVSQPSVVYNVNTEKASEEYKDKYKLNRFGSFFSVAGSADVSEGAKSFMKLRPTRHQSTEEAFTQSVSINAEFRNEQEVYIPAMLATDSDNQIQIYKSDSSSETFEYGLINFPKSSLYIDFDKYSGAYVDRQHSKLNYVVYNVEDNQEIYALVTKKPVNINEKREGSDNYDSLMFAGSAGNYTVVSAFDDNDKEIVPSISLAAIYQTFTKDATVSEDVSKASYYFDNINTIDAYKVPNNAYSYKDLFIPIKNYSLSIDHTNGLDLFALPYNQQYSVSFWIWSVIEESAEGSKYGWVGVPYSNLKSDPESLNFSVQEAPKPSINECVVNYEDRNTHIDGYNNKSLSVQLHNGSSDLYYVVDLYDNTDNSLITHLFTTDRTTYGPFVFDLDGLPSADETTTIYANSSLKNNGQTVMLNVDGKSAYNSFRYGKLPSGDDRYKVVLRPYIIGKGPAALADPNTYDWENDPDSAYKVYRYKKDTNGSPIIDTKEEHISITNIPDSIKQFSLNNSFDKLEKVPDGNVGINVNNVSQLKRTVADKNGPRIEFTINSPDYASYSIAYEKYIPVIMHYHIGAGGEYTYENITNKVFNEDKLYSDDNINIGKGEEVVIGGEKYYMFDFDTVKSIKLSADSKTELSTFDQKDKITNYNLEAGDYISLYLFGYQDIIDNADPNNYLMQIGGVHTTNPNQVTVNAVKDVLRDKLVAKLAEDGVYNQTSGMLGLNSIYDICKSGPFDQGLRLVSAVNTKISGKKITITPIISTGEGTYDDDQLKALADIRTLEKQIESIQAEKFIADGEAAADAEKLKKALEALEKTNTEKARTDYINKAVADMKKNMEMMGNPDWEPTEENMAAFNTNYEYVIVNPLKKDVFDAQIKYGRTEPNGNVLTMYDEEYLQTTIAKDPLEPKTKVVKPGGLKHDPGSADKVKELEGLVTTYSNKINEIKKTLNAKRKLSFKVMFDSQSKGYYGVADITISFWNNNEPVGSAKNFNRNVSIGSTDAAGYGCTLEVNSSEITEPSSDYDEIRISVNFLGANGEATEISIASDAKAKCIMDIKDVQYYKDGTTTQDGFIFDKYSARQISAGFTCTSATVTDSSATSPTATFKFEK